MASPVMTVRRHALAVLCLLALLLSSGLAGAMGRTQWSSKTYKERDNGSWRLDITIYLSRAPDTAHIPVKFEFQPTAYYERSMVDGDKLVERKVPLQGRQSLIESIDIGFMDPGSGKIEKRTKFSFKVTRAHGYEAGEYKVTLRHGRTGQVIGTPTTLVFDGENETIDRRTMVFAAEGAKKKKKGGEMKQVDKEGNVKEEGSESGGESGSEGGEPGGEAASEGGEEAAAEPMPEEGGGEESAAEDPPGEIKEKPGGCGCRIEQRGRSNESLGLLALLGLMLLRRRAR